MGGKSQTKMVQTPVSYRGSVVLLDNFQFVLQLWLIFRVVKWLLLVVFPVFLLFQWDKNFTKILVLPFRKSVSSRILYWLKNNGKDKKGVSYRERCYPFLFQFTFLFSPTLSPPPNPPPRLPMAFSLCEVQCSEKSLGFGIWANLDLVTRSTTVRYLLSLEPHICQ